MNRGSLASIAPSALFILTLFISPCQAQDDLVERLVEHITESTRSSSRGVDRTGSASSKDRAFAKQLRRILKTRKVTVNFDDTAPLEALDFLRDVTGLNMVVSKKARQAIEDSGKTVKLKLNKVRLRNVLILMLESVSDDLCFGVQHGVMMIATKEEFKGRSVYLRVYDISDLTRKKPDFPAPRAGLLPKNEKNP